jgi:hypothetical protein
MPYDFATDYAELSDDNILHLAGERASLTPEAVSALDSELRRRNLTDSHQTKYQRSVRRVERRESRAYRRKIFGKSELSWPEILSAFGAMVLISAAYFSLPSQYRLSAEWQDPAACVMIASVFIVAGWHSLWKELAFWISLILASVIQLAVVHEWAKRTVSLDRGYAKLAALLGFVFFFGIYGSIRFVKKRLVRDDLQAFER